MKDPVVIDSKDTDVVLCAYAAHTMYGVLGSKRNGCIYDCHMLCSKEVVNTIVALHSNS